MILPGCYDCKFNDARYPCRKADGSFDLAKVAGAIVRRGRGFREDGAQDEAILADTAWVSNCEYEVEHEHPEVLLPLIVAAMDACETPRDAGYMAAGLLENAVVNHGPLLINSIEALAARSPKFRYFLAAIWGQNRADPAVWARVCKAVGSDGRMDTDGRGPSDGQPVTVLAEQAATELMKERVEDAARQLGFVS
jgi:hypothetical protein